MASSDDRTDPARGGERPRRQKQTSASSRRRRDGRGREPAPDMQRGRRRASTTGRRRSDSSDRTKDRAPRAARKTTAAAKKTTEGAGRQATRIGEPGRTRQARKPGLGPIGDAAQAHEQWRAGASAPPGQGLLAALWRSLQSSLRRLQRQLRRALATPQAGRILTALLARRLPGPLRVLVEGLGDPDQRGFLFWWMVVTLVLTLAIASVLSIALAPVVGTVALVGVGVWMLIQEDRQPAAQQS